LTDPKALFGADGHDLILNVMRGLAFLSQSLERTDTIKRVALNMRAPYFHPTATQTP
jgi:hypothetical protein